IAYSVLRPTSAQIRIKDPHGATVRSFQVNHLQTGSFTISWDGRDDSGVVVPDGQYALSAEGGVAIPIVVDTVPPEVRFSVRSALNSLDTTSGLTWLDVDGHPDLGVNFTWSVVEDHLSEGVLEQSSEGPSAGFTLVDRFTSSRAVGE